MSQKPFQPKSPKDGRLLTLDQYSPNELSTLLMFRRGCKTCGKPAVVRGKVFYPVDEYAKNFPEIWMGLIVSAHQRREKLPLVNLYTNAAKTKEEPHLRVWDEEACKNHESNLMGRLKQAPSWCCVEVISASDPKNQRQVQVPQ